MQGRSADKLCKLALLLTILLLTSYQAVLAECNYAPQPIDTGLAGYYIVSTDITFDPLGNPDPPEGSVFDTTIRGRTPAEAAAFKTLAVNFFQSEYGIDFSLSDSAQGGAIVLKHEMGDPRWGYKVRYSGDEMVDQTGWDFHDGYYMLEVIGSSATLFGNYGGVGGRFANQGTKAFYGEFVVDYRTPCRNPTTELSGSRVFPYQSSGISTTFPFGRVAYTLDTSGVVGASGTTRGRQLINALSNGDLHVYGHKIIRFVND